MEKCIREASFRTYSMYSFQEERVPPLPTAPETSNQINHNLKQQNP